MAKRKKKKKKARNWHALNAILMSRSTVRVFPDKKKLAARQACRGRISQLD